MKKISLLLVLFLFGCQSLTKKLEIIVPQEKPMVEELPQTRQQFESRDLGTQKVNEKKIKVAMLLPLSGKNKDLGWSLFNAASISLFENDLNHNIELVLFDSKDDPEYAEKAFDKIVDSKIKIVIGPIFSNAVKAIERDARRNGIAVISLSNNQELMGNINNDGGVFISGMLLETQVDKIVNYAMDKGKFNFAVIAPKNQYGSTVTEIYKKIVKNRDGNFITSEFYDSNEKDIDRAVDRVINSFILPSRLTKKGGRNELKKDVVISESDRSYPQVIMIPESGKNLSRIMASIKKQNKDEREFQIIGTSQWDDISTLNDYNIVGAWFAAPENEKFRNFERNYYQSFNKFPPRLTSIAYDSVAAISQLIDAKKGQIPTVADFTNFANPPKNGFEGIDGTFRYLPNGLVQRNLAVLQVGSGRFDTIEKPVEKFLKY